MDGRVAAMSLYARGVYMTLLCICWTNGSLPADLKALGRMVGESRRNFLRVHEQVLECFMRQGDRLVHPRLEKEREKQKEFRDLQIAKGRRSATARAAKRQVSTAVSTDGQPKVNSSISDLRTPVKSATHSAPTDPAPKAPRDHEDPAAKTFILWFKDEFARLRSGADYSIQWPRDMVLVKRLLKTTSYERLQQCAEILLSPETDDPWIESTDRGITILSTKFNWLSDRRATWAARQVVPT